MEGPAAPLHLSSLHCHERDRGVPTPPSPVLTRLLARRPPVPLLHRRPRQPLSRHRPRLPH
eukprot:4068781-Prymnesium_polylepis.1